MPNVAPSHLAYVPFVSVDNMMKLVHHIGIEQMLKGLADYIEDDFRRWDLFDKSPRVASHSKDGVIELMPTTHAICSVWFSVQRRFDSSGYSTDHLRRRQSGLQPPRGRKCSGSLRV